MCGGRPFTLTCIRWFPFAASLIVTCPCALGKQVAAAAEMAMSKARLSEGPAAALIDPPMNSAPSASDIAEARACRASVVLLRVTFITVSF